VVGQQFGVHIQIAQICLTSITADEVANAIRIDGVRL
jgi:hypothetical protein